MNEGKPRLLIVDDDQGVLFLLTRLLGDDYVVTACLDGREALRLLQEQPFDLVVTDLRLPEVSGLDILNAAQALPDASRPAVVIITGYATLDSAIRATSDGASAYIPKPFNADYLRSTLSQSLERRQLARELQESERRYRRLYQQAQQRVQELQLLFEASQLLGQPFDAQAIGQRVGHILKRLFGHPDQRVGVLLFEDETDSLAYAELSVALQGTAEEQWVRMAATCPVDCPVRGGRTLRVGPAHAQRVAERCPIYRPDTQSLLCVPVRIGEHAIGTLHCQAQLADAFTKADERLLATFAGQVAAVLEALGTVRQRERLAVLEERDRMARALHDGLAQRFSYLGLTLDNLLALVEARRLDEVRDDLTRLRHVVDDGQQEIRDAIAGLRQTGDAGSLGAELAALVRRWGREHQIAARFRCATKSPSPARAEGLGLTLTSLQLSPVQAEHLLGIVQEALTNVAKHAQASQVEVVLATRGGENVLTVTDNGAGFDPARVAADDTHFGMIILEERAALMGSRLTVDSAPGQGTRIEVAWPLRADH